jgi:4-hydroxy-4-methyl-2-oxoglutarate aldolase
MSIEQRKVESCALLHRLAALDSCAVSDALDLLGKRGVAPNLHELSVPCRIVGRTVTVQLGPNDGRASKRHLGTAAVEFAGAQSVIVIANQGRLDVAGWGGILSLSASKAGIAGVVIDGACRDLDESRDLGFPVFGRGATPITARRRIIEYEWNVSVVIDEVGVAPDDFVIADGSGVVFIPQEIARQVIVIAERIAAKERLMAEAIKAGSAVSQVMGADYETMLNRSSADVG